MIALKVQEGANKSIEDYIAKELAKVVGQVGTQIHNRIITDESNHPYWSGAYITSWKLSAGSPNTDFNSPEAEDQGLTGLLPVGFFGGPRGAVVKPSANQKVFVTNYAPHAAQIEFGGTPTHPAAWMTAHNAVKAIRATYRFKGSTI